MTGRIAAVAAAELKIALRNRWILTATFMMTAFGLVLALAGSAPAGTVGADRLTVTVASLATLSVYLVPLIALLLSYDAIAGEVERGTLPLLLTYPVSRRDVLAGKLVAQLTVVALAVLIGFGITAAAVWAAGGASLSGLRDLTRLYASAVLLGGTFLAAGFCLSALTRQSAAAASLAIAIWIVAVVLFDVALLGAVVVDDGGLFTTQIFPWLLVAGPTDAFRLFNLSGLSVELETGGLGGSAVSLGVPGWAPLVSMALWPCVLVLFAAFIFRRCEA